MQTLNLIIIMVAVVYWSRTPYYIIVFPIIMRLACSIFKALAEELATSYKAYVRNRSLKNKNATPEEQLERARLAVHWGESVVKCVFSFSFF
jgi:hypothetical protein